MPGMFVSDSTQGCWNASSICFLEEFKFKKDQVTDFHKQIYCSDEVLMPFFCFLKAYPITACKLKLGDLEGALLDTNFAMRDGEDNVKALFHQGQAYMAFGDIKAVVESFKKALDLEPTDCLSLTEKALDCVLISRPLRLLQVKL
ncbi:unnamed protein product [Prunus armeniaca]|uniref:Uncharacterized protein n=1 Tax=Prunus armeniaca TaxID=36596 RepID=A0A6J5XR60_PRUAR|nr:unnamed protein product [Prunus armeniaca]